MKENKLLWKLEGMHTVETVAEEMHIAKQSALNLLSRLKKEGHLQAEGGGKQKRIYKISMKKFRKRAEGMFDILNKYNPNFKLNPWYGHQVHGKYTVEDALVDAVQTESFRAILASLRLFNHITDWPRLYRKAKEKNCWQKIGALYEVARLFLKTRRIAKEYSKPLPGRWIALTRLRKMNFPPIAKRWHIYIPFNENDIKEVAV